MANSFFNSKNMSSTCAWLMAVGFVSVVLGFAVFRLHRRLEEGHRQWLKKDCNRRFQSLEPKEVRALDLDAPVLSCLRELSQWDAASSAARRAAADAVLERLTPGWSLKGLRQCALAEHHHEMAIFEYDDAEFALIPGAEVTLGYDRDDPFVPTAAQLESFMECDFFYDFPDEDPLDALREHFDLCLTPLRTVRFGPMLVESTAQRVNSIDELEAIYDLGFRPPTSDEWEYVCGAGARTLFRWGDDCPTGKHPESTGEDEGWTLHRVPNAFGLIIADNPWEDEYCLERGIWRGGDGGGSGCGGDGAFHGWVALATAYVQVILHQPDAWPGLYRMRRVYPLA